MVCYFTARCPSKDRATQSQGRPQTEQRKQKVSTPIDFEILCAGI